MKHHRLKQLIEALGATPANFEKRYLGESRAKNIYNWTSGDYAMKEETTNRIIEAVKAKRPDFNPEWFKTGEGEMFGAATGDVRRLIGYDDDIIQKVQQLEQEVQFLRRENRLLQTFLKEKGVDLMGKIKVVVDARYLADKDGASESLMEVIFNSFLATFGYNTGYNHLARS